MAEEYSGNFVNYYLARVDHPQRKEQPAYTAECEDLIEALALTPDEANIFKEVWRTANARKGSGKAGHQKIYGAEKLVHYANRILRKYWLESIRGGTVKTEDIDQEVVSKLNLK